MYMSLYIRTCIHVSVSLSSIHAVDIRRVVLSGGVNVSVVVRAGEPYLLKVELPSILPSHSRDVLETIRRVRRRMSIYMTCTLSLVLECVFNAVVDIYVLHVHVVQSS